MTCVPTASEVSCRLTLPLEFSVCAVPSGLVVPWKVSEKVTVPVGVPCVEFGSCFTVTFSETDCP